MQMGEGRIHNKMTHKNGGKMTQNQMDRGYRNERGKLGKNTRKQEVGKQRWLEISL